MQTILQKKIGIYSDICNNTLNNENKSYSFYTSSHFKSKLYYCETDGNWQKLSKKYLKKYDTQEDLLKIYPYKILNKPCN